LEEQEINKATLKKYIWDLIEIDNRIGKYSNYISNIKKILADSLNIDKNTNLLYKEICFLEKCVWVRSELEKTFNNTYIKEFLKQTIKLCVDYYISSNDLESINLESIKINLLSIVITSLDILSKNIKKDIDATIKMYIDFDLKYLNSEDNNFKKSVKESKENYLKEFFIKDRFITTKKGNKPKCDETLILKAFCCYESTKKAIKKYLKDKLDEDTYDNNRTFFYFIEESIQEEAKNEALEMNRDMIIDYLQRGYHSEIALNFAYVSFKDLRKYFSNPKSLYNKFTEIRNEQKFIKDYSKLVDSKIISHKESKALDNIDKYFAGKNIPADRKHLFDELTNKLRDKSNVDEINFLIKQGTFLAKSKREFYLKTLNFKIITLLNNLSPYTMEKQQVEIKENIKDLEQEISNM